MYMSVCAMCIFTLQDTQPDVYETSDLPEDDQQQDVVILSDSVVVCLHVYVFPMILSQE